MCPTHHTTQEANARRPIKRSTHTHTPPRGQMRERTDPHTDTPHEGRAYATRTHTHTHTHAQRTARPQLGMKAVVHPAVPPALIHLMQTRNTLTSHSIA
mmetsp:Transcript_36711/g.91984  ORF Transcript_36711/g.91984 Transcript_36711/m.91984 type:complete len:99 (-) Transcript_36711:1646-1942(-)